MTREENWTRESERVERLERYAYASCMIDFPCLLVVGCPSGISELVPDL